MTNLGKVLLVDHDAVSNYISEHMLRLMHVTKQIAVAKNGLEALELVKEASFGFVLLDVSMPAMDGFEFLEVLKRLQESTGMTAPAAVMLITSEHGLDRARETQYWSCYL